MAEMFEGCGVFWEMGSGAHSITDVTHDFKSIVLFTKQRLMNENV